MSGTANGFTHWAAPASPAQAVASAATATASNPISRANHVGTPSLRTWALTVALSRLTVTVTSSGWIGAFRISLLVASSMARSTATLRA